MSNTPTGPNEFVQLDTLLRPHLNLRSPILKLRQVAKQLHDQADAFATEVAKLRLRATELQALANHLDGDT